MFGSSTAVWIFVCLWIHATHCRIPKWGKDTTQLAIRKTKPVATDGCISSILKIKTSFSSSACSDSTASIVHQSMIIIFASENEKLKLIFRLWLTYIESIKLFLFLNLDFLLALLLDFNFFVILHHDRSHCFRDFCQSEKKNCNFNDNINAQLMMTFFIAGFALLNVVWCSLLVSLSLARSNGLWVRIVRTRCRWSDKNGK